MANNIQFDAAKISILAALGDDKSKWWQIPVLQNAAHLGMWPIKDVVEVLKSLVTDGKIKVSSKTYRIKLK